MTQPQHDAYEPLLADAAPHTVEVTDERSLLSIPTGSPARFLRTIW